MLTEATLRRLWPHVDEAKPGLIAAVLAAAPHVFAGYNLTTPLVVAHFMAQLSHEFGADLPARAIEFEENLNYSTGAMMKAWPSRFPSSSSTLPYVHNPKKLANYVYGSRMGNQPGSDDGWNFRGRGASQVTGREGYGKLAKAVGLDLIGHPELVNANENFLVCAAADYILCGCLPYAQRDDIRGETHHLNGGYNGLSQREAWLKRWKAALAEDHPELGAPEAPPRPPDGTLRYGDNNFEVKAMQVRLNELGYATGGADGDFGRATREAVLAFQADNDISTTGMIDAATRSALQSAPPKPIAEERATTTEAELRASGSETVAKADWAGYVGKAGMVIGSGEAADKLGFIDTAKSYVDEFGGLHATLDYAKDMITWMDGHIWIAVVVGGIAVWYFGRKIIQRRLADHRSGANLGR